MNNRRRLLINIIRKHGGYAKVPVWLRISKDIRTKAYQIIGMPTSLIDVESLTKIAAPKPKFHFPIETRHFIGG